MNRLAGLEAVVDEVSRAYMGFNQPQPQTSQPEQPQVSPERFAIGLPIGLQPNQNGGTLPSAAPPAGVFNQQTADFGTAPANVTSKPEARTLAPEFAGAKSFQESSPTYFEGHSQMFSFQAGGPHGPQQVPAVGRDVRAPGTSTLS